MSRRRAGAAMAALAMAAAGWASTAPDVAAAGSGACPGSSGVTVVVDFGSLGGGTQVRCAPGDPSSGLQALTAAGFSYGFVPRVPGLICQIEGRPEPCNGAPVDAYWTYSYHDPGGSGWTYSQIGAGSRDPRPGGVEGWAFGAGREPGIAPPSPSPTTTPTAAPSTAHQPPAPTTVPAAGGAPTSGAPSSEGSESAGPDLSGEAAESDEELTDEGADEGVTTTGPATRSSSPDRGDDDGGGDRGGAQLAGAPDRGDDGDSGGGPGGTLVGLVVVGTVAVGGALVARRRRSGFASEAA